MDSAVTGSRVLTIDVEARPAAANLVSSPFC